MPFIAPMKRCLADSRDYAAPTEPDEPLQTGAELAGKDAGVSVGTHGQYPPATAIEASGHDCIGVLEAPDLLPGFGVPDTCTAIGAGCDDPPPVRAQTRAQ